MIQVFDYERNSIQFDVIDGRVMANATSMCSTFNKRVNDWISLPSTKRYLEAVTRKSGIAENQLVAVRKGGSGVQGTWINEKLIIKLAQWLDVDFELWCDEKISELIKSNNERDEYQEISKHTDRATQVSNSKQVNSYNFKNGGKEHAIQYNRINCIIHTHYTPSEIKDYAKKKGLASKIRTSAKEIMRHMRPEVSASMSMADDFCKTGKMQIEEAAAFCKANALPIFLKMKEIGILGPANS